MQAAPCQSSLRRFNRALSLILCLSINAFAESWVGMQLADDRRPHTHTKTAFTSGSMGGSLSSGCQSQPRQSDGSGLWARPAGLKVAHACATSNSDKAELRQARRTSSSGNPHGSSGHVRCCNNYGCGHWMGAGASQKRTTT